jgi:hypothetical protein
MPLLSAVTDLRLAKQALALAQADGLLFRTTQETRLSRGASQTLLQAEDDPAAHINELRAQVDKRLTDTLSQLTPSLGPADAARAAEIMARWRGSETLHEHLVQASGGAGLERHAGLVRGGRDRGERFVRLIAVDRREGPHVGSHHRRERAGSAVCVGDA